MRAMRCGVLILCYRPFLLALLFCAGILFASVNGGKSLSQAFAASLPDARTDAVPGAGASALASDRPLGGRAAAARIHEGGAHSAHESARHVERAPRRHGQPHR